MAGGVEMLKKEEIVKINSVRKFFLFGRRYRAKPQNTHIANMISLNHLS